jgi:hypothetical protein
MPRGGRKIDRDDPERRCIVSGESGVVDEMIRFVLSPDGVVTPDLAEKLPGRGIWVTSTRAALETAISKRLFSRAAKAQAIVPDGMADLVAERLALRAIDAVAMTRKAGLAVTGFEKVKARLKKGPVGALIGARDGSEQGQAKLRPMAGEADLIHCFDSAELGLAFGRDFVIHAALDRGGATWRVLREAKRLSGFRPCAATHKEVDPDMIG